MPLKLDNANVIVRGNFNPYIISPDWLAKQNIWRCDEVRLELGTIKDGMRFRSADVEWLIDNKGLAVASNAQDCGELTAKVLETLPHTPVSAVGSNFIYLAERNEWNASPLPRLGDSGRSEISIPNSPEEARWSGVFRVGEIRIELMLVDADEGVTVRLNHHRIVKSAADAVVAARNFPADRSLSERMIVELLQQTVA